MHEESTNAVAHDEGLAREIAAALDDDAGYPAYLALTKRYSEKRLRAVLDQVLAMPQERIRKSRAALFTYLVRHSYAGEDNHTVSAADAGV